MKIEKLQKKWYKILKEAGFRDLEYFDSTMEPHDLLQGNSKFSPSTESQIGLPQHLLAYESTESYYRSARELTHMGVFSSDVDRQVWAYHAEGLSLREIGKKVGFSHPKVLRIIRKYLPEILEVFR